MVAALLEQSVANGLVPIGIRERKLLYRLLDYQLEQTATKPRNTPPTNAGIVCRQRHDTVRQE